MIAIRFTFCMLCNRYTEPPFLICLYSMYCETCNAKVCWDCVKILNTNQASYLTKKYRQIGALKAIKKNGNIKHMTLEDRTSLTCLNCEYAEHKFGSRGDKNSPNAVKYCNIYIVVIIN